jgi:ribosome-binding protein aMBF1 (putative translation factor)
MKNQADCWKDFRKEFEQLTREEQGREIVITKGKALQSMDHLLRASCSYTKHPEVWEKGKPEQGCFCLLETPPHGVWDYSDGVSENFLERFRLCVAKAGRALLDYPKGTDAEDFWLHRLYLDLLKNNSDQLFAASQEGGMIVSVCVASATFCSRLERKALETNGAEERSSADTAEGKHTHRSHDGGRMSWEQEQLEINPALIEDAAKDTTLWLQANPSAEERVHVLAIQAGLADLARIVERRMNHLTSVARMSGGRMGKDDASWSQTVAQVLSRLKKAREARGNKVVGNGLVRLAINLPEALPGSLRVVTDAEMEAERKGLRKIWVDYSEAESSRVENNEKTTRSPESAPTNAAADLKMRIGQNIEKLKKECGWSADKLADKTGIDKKSILSHMHGKSKPNPKTLKEYAQAFSKELNRPITANKLEE